MDWKLFVTSFATVFVAELGDKTQLATLGLASASEGGRLTVFLGSSAALVATSLIAVIAGAALARYISPVWLERAGGALMIAVGAWVLWKAR